STAPSVTPTNGIWRGETAGTSLTRTASVQDGSDVSIRFQVGENHNTPVPFQSTFKLENPSDTTQYWGLQLYTVADGQGGYLLQPKLVWGLSGSNSGSRNMRWG